MNYYEHHLGDYDGATAHLSWLEDCAYRRLIGLYYRTEEPIPADLKQACRLVRAASKPERDAVQQVLEEFFTLSEDGWHNARCDEDIAAFHELEPEREAKRENAKERQRRARARRADLFDALRRHNVVPAFDTPTRSLEALLSRVTSGVTEDNGNAQRNAPVTRDDTATHTHYPLPTTQTQITPTESASASRADARDPPNPPPEPSAAGAVCLAMRQAGLSAVNPGDPRLLALIAQGATLPEFAGVARDAADRGKGWAWALVALEARRRDAASITLARPAEDPAARARLAQQQAEEERRAAERKRDAELRSPEGRARATEARRLALAAIGRTTTA